MAWNEIGNIRGPKGDPGADAALSSSDRAAIDAAAAATYSNTANSLMKRTSAGATSVSTPTASIHAANKAYVDAQMGKANGMTDAERVALFGSASYTAKPYGSLVWGNTSPGWYNPAGDSFTRLRASGSERLVVNRSVNGAAALSGGDAYLYAPVTGIYSVTCIQTFGNDQGARGVGLGRSTAAGDRDMVIWQDFAFGRFATASATVYLTAGTRLYPWVWAPPNAGMSYSDRGVTSEYSIAFVASA